MPENMPSITVDPSLKDKWFKRGEEVILSGTYSSIGIPTITVDGKKAAVDTGKKTWTYTFIPHPADTKGETVSIDLSAGTEEVHADYTLKIDTVAPSVTLVVTEAQYEDSGVNWYKMSETAGSISAVGTDATSGIGVMTKNGKPYENTTEDSIDLSKELEQAETLTYTAVDKAGNAGESKSYTYNVDGSGPEIGTVTADSFSGSSRYVDETGTVWFRKGDDSATLSVTITDAKSGLMEASLGELEYVNGKFSGLDTSEDLSYTDAITAEDNVGNTAKSAAIRYKVDGLAPVIQVSHDPAAKIAASVTVTADISDGIGSGVKVQQYSFDGGTTWTDYTGAFRVTKNGEITFRAVDNVGNVSTATHTVSNIDMIHPIVTISADTTTIQDVVVFSVKAEDVHSDIDRIAYSTDNGVTWSDCSFEKARSVEVSLTAEQNYTTWLFQAWDEAKNVSEIQSVTFNNIYNGTEDTFSVIDQKELSAGDEMTPKVLSMTENSVLETGLDSSIKVDTLILDGSSISNKGSVSAKTMDVTGKKSSIAGDAISASKIFLEENAELAMDKDQYDVFMAKSSFEDGSAGTLIVARAEGNSLQTKDINTLMSKKNVNSVQFAEDLISVNKLNFSSSKEMTIGFANAYGTEKNDTICFKKGTSVTFGRKDGVIDLEGGNNKFQVDGNAESITILSALTNVSTVQIGGNAEVTLADLEFSDANKASLKVSDKAGFEAGSVTCSALSNTVTIGKEAVFSVGNITFGDDKDSLSIGNSANFKAGDVSSLETVTFDRYSTSQSGKITGVQKFTVKDGSYDKKSAATLWTGLTVSDVTGTDGNDTFTFGNYTHAVLGNLDFGEGKDKLTINKYAFFEAKDVAGAGTISFGNESTVQTGTISDVQSLTLKDGTCDKSQSAIFCTTLTASDVTGTDGNDTFTFGNYTHATLGNVDFGEGKDKLTVNKSAVFEAKDVAGAGTITFGSGSSIQAGVISGVQNLSLKDGSYDKKQSASVWTSLTASDVTGTEGNDKFTIGNYTDTKLGTIHFGTGNDKLTIGKYAQFNASGILDFGSGKDKDQISVGNWSIVVLKARSADTLSKFTIGKETEAYLSSELRCKVKADKSAVVYDIGSWNVAEAFTSITDETSDNKFTEARTLTEKEYFGWLNEDLDTADFFRIGRDADSIIGLSPELLFTQYDRFGDQIGEAVAFSGTFAFDENAETFSISMADSGSDDAGGLSVAYRMQLNLTQA